MAYAIMPLGKMMRVSMVARKKLRCSSTEAFLHTLLRPKLGHKKARTSLPGLFKSLYCVPFILAPASMPPPLDIPPPYNPKTGSFAYQILCAASSGLL